MRLRIVESVPPPPADCTAVVESPARKKAGGFAFGAATVVDVRVAMVTSRGSAEKCILTKGCDNTVLSNGAEHVV